MSSSFTRANAADGREENSTAVDTRALPVPPLSDGSNNYLNIDSLRSLNGASDATATPVSDSDLMTRVAAGDAEAFGVLMERHKRYVFNIGWKILKDRAEADDMVQQVFAVVYDSAAGFNPEGNFKAWLFNIAFHDALNRKQYLRNRGFYKSDSLDECGGKLTRSRSITNLSLQEEDYLIGEFLNSLSPAQRNAIELTKLEGLTVKEAATVLKVSESVVANNLHRAMVKLRTLARNKSA